MKNTLQEYFDFTRSERRGFLYLIFLILFLFSLPKLTSFFVKEKTYDYTAFQQEIDEWETGLINQDSLRKSQYEGRKKSWDKKKTWNNDKNYSKNKSKSNSKTKPKVEINPFPFNPNEATKSQLLDLGLPERTVKVFLNFRSKGGKFYKNEDLKKVYGLKDEWYQALESFIRIPKRTYEPKENYKEKDHLIAENIPKSYEEKPKKYEREEPKKKTYKKVIVDINTASTEEFQKIYGIGAYYAKNIVKYRESLGGFSSVGQVGETYGIPDSTFQNIKPSLKKGTTIVQQININTATIDELKVHPYIKWKIASTIVKYRDTHGKYTTVSDLKKNYAISKELFGKLEPYLTVD